MTTITEKLAEALRLMIERAACEVGSLHELGRDDDDTAEEAAEAETELEYARAALAEWEESVQIPDCLPIGTRIRMLENRNFWKAGEVTELVSCLGWGDAEQSMDTSGDYWARGNDVKMFCTSRNDFEVLDGAA